MKLASFDRPRKTLDFARKAVNDAESAARDFLQHKAFARAVEFDPETRHYVHKVRLVGPIPDTVERAATEALNNTRNGFDQIIFSACDAIGKRVKDSHFPWRDNPKAVRRSLENGKIASELWDVLERQEPYRTSHSYAGGNDLIRHMSEIANAKHTIGFVVCGKVASITLPTTITASPGEKLGFRAPVWDSVKNEMILFTTTSAIYQGANDQKIAFYIAFDESEPVGGTPFDFALGAFLQKADSALNEIERRCAEIIAAKANINHR